MVGVKMNTLDETEENRKWRGKKKGEKGRNKDLLNYGLLNIIPYKANTTIA